MSYKIADFTNKHKVSYVTNGVEKFASAVKIGNTNKFGWYEPTTPTEKAKLHTYLDFNDFNPKYFQTCLKSERTWFMYGWNGKRKRKINGTSNGVFPEGNIELKKGHPPLSNRTSKNSFGNAQINEYSNGKLMSDFRWWGNCEIERHNVPFVGTKYAVSFWMYVKQDYKRDSFVFYQNNCKWMEDDEKDDKLRFLNNLSSNQLEVNTQSFRKSAKVTITQRFNDFKANNNKFGGAFNYGGLKFEIPQDTWVFVTVSMNMNKMFVCYNDQIATSKKFKYSDIKYDNTTTNKVGHYSKKDAYKQPGRNYNFNTIEDADRLLGLGIKGSSIQIADFRIYSNVAFTDPVNKIIAHIQNHRNQVGDLPQVLKPGFNSDELSVKQDDDDTFLDEDFFDFDPIEQTSSENDSVSIDEELKFALNDSNELNSRDGALKDISQRVNVDYDLLYDQILDEGLTNLSF